MKKTRVAVNGFGRIGRAFIKRAIEEDALEVVAVNDLGTLPNLTYLLRYDTVYGRYEKPIEEIPHGLSIGGHRIAFFSEKDPERLPWRDMEVDVVVESTGVFTSFEKAKVHLESGAKRVVISAPVKEDAPPGISGDTVLVGVNEEKLKTCTLSANGSCTTNAGSPVIAILDEALGVEAALLNTTHAYTATQMLVDGTKKDWREGRAAAQNIIPTSTGSAIAVTKAYKELGGRFDGIALRVPVVAGSIADITFISKKSTTQEEVNDILRKASSQDRWKGIFRVSDEELVSSDIIGDTHASIADLPMTRVVHGTLVKVLAWYDNEAGYTETLVRHVRLAGEHL